MEARVPPDSGDVRPATGQPSWWRRSWKVLAAVFGVLGIGGAVGGYLVNAIGPEVEERIAGGGSIGITVREDPQGGGDGFNVAARSPEGFDAKLRKAKDCDSLFQLAKQAGAVDVGRSIHHVLLEGRTRREVALVSMRAKILKRTPVLTGAEVSCASAGAMDAIGVGFDLDEPAPTARTIEDLMGGELGDRYFQGGNIVTLKKTELQPLLVLGLVSDSYVEWEIEAQAIVDGEEETIRIDNDGRPFRLTGAPKDVADPLAYDRYYEWVWYETPQRLYLSDRPNTP
jgi:hypothetical protein